MKWQWSVVTITGLAGLEQYVEMSSQPTNEYCIEENKLTLSIRYLIYSILDYNLVQPGLSKPNTLNLC